MTIMASQNKIIKLKPWKQRPLNVHTRTPWQQGPLVKTKQKWKQAMWDHLWMAWWQHKKWNHAQQSTKNDWDSLSVWRQLTMMSKIGQWLKCQKWKIVKENKVEKCSFCTTFYLHFIFSTNCSEQNVLFSLKHKLKTWTVLFFAHFFLMNQKW